MLESARQHPSPLRELLAFGNAPQPAAEPQQQPQKPLPPPRPPQLRPEALQGGLAACSSAAASASLRHLPEAGAAAANAVVTAPQQPVPTAAGAANGAGARADAGATGPPEVRMQEAGDRAPSPGIYSLADTAGGAGGDDADSSEEAAAADGRPQLGGCLGMLHATCSTTSSPAALQICC